MTLDGLLLLALGSRRASAGRTARASPAPACSVRARHDREHAARRRLAAPHPPAPPRTKGLALASHHVHDCAARLAPRPCRAKALLSENRSIMTTGKPSAKYVRLSGSENAVDYLEKACAALDRIDRRPEEWKWVVIAIHGALYGFAICMLQGTDPDLVTQGPRNHLISFDEALRRCQEPEHVTFYVHSKPLTLSKDQHDAIRFLKKVRNQIEHYVPKTWLIELHNLAISSLEALSVIRFLALESGNARLTAHQQQQVDSRLAKAARGLRASQLYKDHVAAAKRAARTKGGR